MTIVLALKVGDGVVLGADSASTIVGDQNSYHNSYFNAEKLFNLVKGMITGERPKMSDLRELGERELYSETAKEMR